MSHWKITLGQDVSAYLTIDVPASTDLSDTNLESIARQAVDDCVFDPEWSTATALRVISVTDEQRHVLREDVSIEASPYDGGQLLQLFLRGHLDLNGLLIDAARLRLLPSLDTEQWSASVGRQGKSLAVFAFKVRRGASRAELGLAVLDELTRLSSIELKRILPVSPARPGDAS